jgi:hypothetical protein
VPEINEAVPVVIQQIDAAAIGADPQVAFFVFCYGRSPHCCSAVRVRGLMPEAGEIILCPIKPVQSIDRPDPQVMLLVFTDTPDIAIAEAGRIGRVVPVGDYFGAVIAVQSIPGSKPDKSLTVLEDSFYGTVGQTLVIRKMGKCQFGRLGGKGDCANKRRHATDEIFFHHDSVSKTL